MQQKLRILLVEDDQDDYILTREILDEAFGQGHLLDWARSYSEALEAISLARHDVYLFDYRLGSHNGLDLIRRITGSHLYSSPVILLTGMESREVDMRAMEFGATDYLVKSQLCAPLIERSIRYAIEQKKTEQRLLKLAHFDPLTGLANRSLFHSRLEENIAHAKRVQDKLALLLLDLDHFKEINDSLGHPVGDVLLCKVGEQLSACIRETDIVARLGGDEFVIIATHLRDDENASNLAQRIIDAIKKGVELESQWLSTSTSIGIAIYPRDGTDADELLKNADLALYQAKDAGRGGYRFFDPQLNAQVQSRKALQKDLEKALQSQSLEVYFQPILDASSAQVVGAEALLRWRHPERGFIPPDVFIPIAESSGLIGSLGEWVLRNACTQHSKWREAGLPAIQIAVNISSVQFRRGDLVDSIANIIDESGIHPCFLDLEITESMLMEVGKPVRSLLHGLHALGVKLAIDDFGTGYSSLAYLKRFPVDKLKIDRSFVGDITNDPDDATIARAVISLGKSLNLVTVAEGVETKAQLEFLRREKCDQVQGYYFSRPIPGDEFCSWFGEYQKDIRKSKFVPSLPGYMS